MKKGEVRKIDLLAAGMNVLHERGYNGTSINDIVKAAEMPKGSFYFYFDSKEQFAIEAIDYYIEEGNREFMTLLNAEEGSAKDRLLNFYHHRIDINVKQLQCNRGCLVANLAGEMSDVNEQIRLKTKYHFDMTMEALATVIEEAQIAGEIVNEERSKDLASAIEEAWRGALTTMKACQCEAPLNNFKNIILKYLLK